MKHDKTAEALLDSGRANTYMLAYLDIAVKNARIDKSAAEAIRQGLLNALDMYTASEALEKRM